MQPAYARMQEVNAGRHSFGSSLTILFDHGELNKQSIRYEYS